MKVGTRTAGAGISSMIMHQRAHAGARHRIFRREAVLRRDFVEIFGDDGRVGDDCAIVVERRHHAVRVELEIIGLELVAFEKIELHFVESQLLGIEHEAHALAAGRLRRVVELVGHVSFPRFF